MYAVYCMQLLPMKGQKGTGIGFASTPNNQKILCFTPNKCAHRPDKGVLTPCGKSLCRRIIKGRKPPCLCCSHIPGTMVFTP